jgi:rhodanese-related sulfurtransferase
MGTFPLALDGLIGHAGTLVVYLLIGFAFGYVLEIAGFGYAPKLAAQFYLTDMTVLKVMFSGIVVAMVLIFAATGLGLLDYNLIWVNPTYLWPGIVGGLIMGVGFIVGGLCPGTSLVALGTFKIDGVFYVLGVFFGVFVFGETVDNFSIFWNSSYLGRLTLMDVFGLDTGWVVLLVVLMALGMFAGAELLERIVGKRNLRIEPRARFAGAAALIAVALAVLTIGQPTAADRWQAVASAKTAALAERQVQVQPGEVLHLMHDHDLSLVLLDARSESDFNLFHLADARRVTPDDLAELLPEFRMEPATTVFLVMSNDEAAATEIWKTMVAESVMNVYILEGGINGWLDEFAAGDQRITPIADQGKDALRYSFAAALGEAYPASFPDPEKFELTYDERVKLELKRGPAGKGCG